MRGRERLQGGEAIMSIIRSALSTVSLAALLFAGGAAPLAAQTQAGGAQQQIRPYPGQGFCRQPASLPQLPEEVRYDQNLEPVIVGGGRPRGYTGRARTGEAPSAIPAPPPPPPMSAPVMADAAPSVASARPEAAPSATGSRTSERRILPPRPPYPPYPVPPRPQPYPQAGLLTAGEHDDLLNPQLYARYLHRSQLGQQLPDLPAIDTQRLVTVRVTDANGRGVPFADVTISCSDGNRLTLSTQADGRVVLFPDLDRLSPSISVEARYGRAALGEARVVQVPRSAGVQEIGFTLPRATSRTTNLDLMLVIDTTGSMGDEIRYLQTELRSIIQSLRQRHSGLDLRVGFVFYRDLGDDYVTSTIPLSADVNAAQSALMQYSAGGGGDYPEAMDQALIRAVGQRWRPNAIHTMLLVADAPPHDERIGRSWAAAEAARARRVHIVPVAASGVADKAEYVMRAMAAMTQSPYLFLTDDSGVGNAHAEPDVDCYLVTRLDAALRRVIDSQLSGVRVEPAEQEVIRQIGDYQNGRCILPANFSTQG